MTLTSENKRQSTLPHTSLGRTGLRVSRLGFGGATLGFCEGRSEADLKAVVRSALAGGVTFFDTAPDYRASERLIGEALREALADTRNSVVLATKVGRYQTLENNTWHVYEDWSADGVYRSIERSLQALQVATLDLAQLHSPPLEVLKRGDAFKGLRRAQMDGLVRHLGISADGGVARWALTSSDFETLQLSYSVLEQDAGNLTEEARRRGVGIIVKQPVANGIPDLDEKPGHPDWAQKWERAQAMVLDTLGEKGERTTGALRWLLADERVDTAIVGTSSLKHLRTNLEAARSPLSEKAFISLQNAWRTLA